MRVPLRPTALLLAALLAGCSLLPGHHEEPQPDPLADEVSEDVALHVANHNWSDVVVFAVRGTARVRLGDVTTGSEADFVVPRSIATGGQVTVVLHPIGGNRDFSTGPIMVSPGQQIDLRVENALQQTNWSVT